MSNQWDNLEKQAWESFEVGAYDEIEELFLTHPDNAALNHLYIVSKVEEGAHHYELPKFIEKKSIFYSLAKAYQEKSKYNLQKASDYLKTYLQIDSAPLCQMVIQFSVKLFFENSDYKYCLYAISKDKNPENGKFFAKEKIVSLYNIQRYADVVQNFKAYYQFIKEESDVFFIVGMSLIQLGKYKEAEAIMNKFPGNNQLPSYEDKKKEYGKSEQEIEKLKSKPSPTIQDLRDLGFAYLFNAEYDKAEEMFQKAATVMMAA
jgi:hypothetical protein